MIFGPHPLDGENTRIYYCRLLGEIKVKIADELERMRSGKLSQPDCGFMGYIFALNQLATADRAIQGLAIFTDQVKDWENEYCQWLAKTESKIPNKHRDAYKQMVSDQFEELKAKSSPLPRDMW